MSEIVSFHKFPLPAHLSYGQKWLLQCLSLNYILDPSSTKKYNPHLGLFATGIALYSLNNALFLQIELSITELMCIEHKNSLLEKEEPWTKLVSQNSQEEVIYRFQVCSCTFSLNVMLAVLSSTSMNFFNNPIWKAHNNWYPLIGDRY